MPASYSDGPCSHRPFIVTPYVVGRAGSLEPEMPSCCPQGARGGERCRLSVHHRRRRKRGPAHPLAVIACRTHGGCFTLYPPGYAPYQRQPLERLSPDGRTLGGEGGDDPGATELAGTLFEAAADAREGRAWAREELDPRTGLSPDRWWSTQGRHLDLAARLIGVAAELAERVRESLAAVLSVGTLALREKTRQARGYRGIGEAVCAVLTALRRGPGRSRALLVCGHLVGRWGEPMHWDAHRGVLLRSPFCGTAQGAAH